MPLRLLLALLCVHVWAVQILMGSVALNIAISVAFLHSGV